MPVKDASASIPTGIVSIVNLLRANAALREDSFTIQHNNVLCDLGGSFRPTAAEMEELAAVNSTASCPIGCILSFRKNDNFAWDGPVGSLYVDCLRRYTHFDNINLRVTGIGQFELVVYANGNNVHKPVLRKIVNFGNAWNEVILPRLDLGSLPPDCRLYLQVSCQSVAGAIRSFRWQGEVPAQKASLGERVYLIRTYGGRASVKNTLLQICPQLQEMHPEILQRTLFIIYDASGDTNIEPMAPLMPSARILELRGPNLGGGGNSSLLVSLLLRLGADFAGAIAELLIMDDDAHIDAETIIRQDAFITARKDNVVSAGVVCFANEPARIQEAGAFWGKFLSPDTNRIDAAAGSMPVFAPYLVRAGKDLRVPEEARELAMHQPAQFATFIFISFPYELMLRVGAPYPFFLRNDDVEICMRCAEHGAVLAVNPNVYAWHHPSQTVVSEFYCMLHALVLNCAYGGLPRYFFLAVFLERIGRIAHVRNAIMLKAYALVLQKFALGPGWHKGAEIFREYAGAREEIKREQAQLAEAVPWAVIHQGHHPVYVGNLVDVTPPEPLWDRVVFHDIPASTYYRLDVEKARQRTDELLAECLEALGVIAKGFDKLAEAWRDQVRNFEHAAFWNEALAGEKLEIVCASLEAEEAADEDANMDEVMPPVLNVGEILHLGKTELPADFNPDGYLQRNPDVAKSGLTPGEHWLRYGQFEGRGW